MRVAQEDGSEAGGGQGPDQEDPGHAAPVHRGPCEPRDPGREEDGHEDEEVAVGQALQDPGGGHQHEPAPAAVLHEAVRAEEEEGDEVRAEHLQVGELGGAIGGEAVGEAGDEAQARTQAEGPGQQVHGEAGQGERRDEGDVVGDERGSAQPLEGRRQGGEPHEVLGKRQHAGDRVEDRAVPPGLGEGNGVRVPPQQPRVQQRVDPVVDHPVPEAQGERKGRQDRQEAIQEEDAQQPG